VIERADAGLGGVLFIVAVIIANVVGALRRGKPPTAPSPSPAPSRPRSPAPVSQRMREIWEEPVAAPVLIPAEISGPSPDIDAAARRLEAAEAALNAPQTTPHAWATLRIRGREEWQKAIIVSEVLQPPLALRPNWF
jgi:hypothetical protein